MSDQMTDGSPDAELPRQPDWEAWCTYWGAYDVPRMWDSVSGEGDKRGWDQIQGFEGMAAVLRAHARTLTSQRSRIETAWQSEAASVVLAKLTNFIHTLQLDANCADSTARGLDGIMSTLAGAKKRMEVVNQQWNDVTTDWLPEWWDHSADSLNREAREVMVAADQAIAYHRTKIIVPSQYPDDVSGMGPIEGDLAGSNEKPSRTSPPPPIPGHPPLTRTSPGGPSLEGSPQLVPAVPGQPVSMLPIAPGSPYSPNGGAYILPGPGVGSGGYIVPMPIRGANGGNAASLASGQRSAAGYPAIGMMPVPQPGQQRGRSSGGRRQGDTEWEVARGVPPVIKPDDALVSSSDDYPPATSSEDAFKTWFSDLATPWRKGPGEPTITIRKGQS